MKAFRVGEGKEARHFYTVAALRRYLRSHPEIPSAVKEHWYYGDLVEETELSRREIFNATTKKLAGGATAQWAAGKWR